MDRNPLQRVLEARRAQIGLQVALVAALLAGCTTPERIEPNKNPFIIAQQYGQQDQPNVEEPQGQPSDLPPTQEPVDESVTPTVSRSDNFETDLVIRGVAYPVQTNINEVAPRDEVTLREETINNGATLYIFEADPRSVSFELENANGDYSNWNVPQRETAEHAYNRLRANNEDVIAIFNADYFGDFGGEGTSILNGQLIHLGYRAGLVIYDNGRAEIKVLTEEDIMKGNIRFAIGGGPQVMKEYSDNIKVASMLDTGFDEHIEVAIDSMLKDGFDSSDPKQVAYRKKTYREVYPQMIVAIKDNTDGTQTIAIATTAGASGYQVVNRLREQGYTQAMCFDSGGSVQSIYNGKKILVMEEAGSARGVANFLKIVRR